MEERDNWSKIEIIGGLFLPLLVAAVGMYYTYQKDKQDDYSNRMERYLNLAKSLDSDQPTEQQFAMSLIENEKKTGNDDIIKVLSEIATPKLLALANSTPDNNIAKRAEGLAINLTEQTPLSNQVKSTIAITPARLFFHIQDESQRPKVKADVNELKAKLNTETLTIPGIELVKDGGPKESELRYFRKNEQSEADSILKVLQNMGVPAKLTYVAGYENSNKLRTRTFEYWKGKQ